MAPLLSYAEALSLVSESVQSHGRSERISSANGLNRILAEDIASTEPNPRFNNSSVDGYVLGQESDAGPDRLLEISGVCVPGGDPGPPLLPGECRRILTGAPTPPEAFGVVMQEDVTRSGNQITLNGSHLPGQFIRMVGSEFGRGQRILAKGHPINPGTLGLLGSQGIGEIEVFQPVTVAIITTGNEVAGDGLGPYQIRNSNGPMLVGLVESVGAQVVSAVHVLDEPEDLGAAMHKVGSADIVITSGGVSVGDFDYVPSWMRKHGEVIFHGLKVRPGKPLLFGKYAQSWVFGLPGNPASSFVGFQTLVRKAIAQLSGRTNTSLMWTRAAYMDTHLAHGRGEFVRVEISQGQAFPVAEQGSFGLRSLALCTALALLPHDRDVAFGEPVDALILI